ncbi:transporter substrate-binding domain-containing protein [Magnetovibrio sp. PR-2]|uniref:substrate-binding periplasmic protein n=1 Tax=Magnetovibrio sp. PR-2 TaxID=3120356 RepID=UPI002FCDFE6B
MSLLLWGVSVRAQSAKPAMVIGALSAPPYVFLDDQSNPKGILVEKITRALDRLGIKPVFEINNWSRAFRRVKNGDIDAIIPALKSPDREAYLVYPKNPIALFNMMMAKHVSDPRQTVELNDINGLTVGRIRGARVTPAFDEALQAQKFDLAERATFGQLALGVAHQRLDYAVGPELMLMWGAGERGVLRNLSFLEPSLGQGPVYLAISKHSQFVLKVEEISESIHDVEESSAFKEALRPYSTFLHLDLFEKLNQASKVHKHSPAAD